MNNDLLQKLKVWRKKTANLEGVEAFQVFHNRVLENIAELKPKNKDELIAIKGIRDRKYAKYGEDVLAIVNNYNEVEDDLSAESKNEPLSVSTYLDLLNKQLSKYHARIQGEISSVDEREKVIYFSLKDSEDESVINCLMWRSSYSLSGIDFEIGMEVIVEGLPDIYKPASRFAFKVSVVELVGEGALKKAYDKLKIKLNKEGLFSEERKRLLPIFPEKIGLITSKDGAAIGDFQINLGCFGFKISFIDSRVEGQQAVEELFGAIKTFKNKDIEVLVLIRGGGSLESLLPFNNEILVREIANFPVPVLVGVGHEKDISLMGLVADKMVSTPTATAETLNDSWQKAGSKVQINEHKIFSIFNNMLFNDQKLVINSFYNIRDQFQLIFDGFNNAEQSFLRAVVSVRSRISEIHRKLDDYPSLIIRDMYGFINQIKQSILSIEDIIKSNNPERQLKLGYSIVKLQEKVIKSISQIQKGQNVEVNLQDGSFKSDVIEINKS